MATNTNVLFGLTINWVALTVTSVTLRRTTAGAGRLPNYASAMPKGPMGSVISVVNLVNFSVGRALL